MDWVQLVGVLAAGGVLTAALTAWANRKITGATATAKVIESAHAQIDSLQEDVINLRTERDEARAEARKERAARHTWEQRQADWWHRAYEVDLWVRRQLIKARERGEELETPPTIFPPPGE